MNRPTLLRFEEPAQVGKLCAEFTRMMNTPPDGLEFALGSDVTRIRNESWQGEGLPAICAIAAQVLDTRLESAVQIVGQLLEFVGAKGATLLNLQLAPLSRSGTRESGKTKPNDEATEFSRYQDALYFAHELLHSLRHTAESTGVDLAIEAAAGGFLLSPVEARELIDAAHSPALGICVDVARVATIGQPADWVRTLSHRTKAVRIGGADWKGGRTHHYGELLDEIVSTAPIIFSSPA